MEINHSKTTAATLATTNGSHSTQQQQSTTDALIINSNSSAVSQEIITQLQEQFGDTKQIYILNTNSGGNGGTIQYLVVDKEVDINVLMQDPNILQQTGATVSSTQQQPHQQPAQAQTAVANVWFNQQKTAAAGLGNAISSSTSRTLSQPQQPLQHNDIEETINRVQEAPPKRKKVDYNPLDPSGTASTYQEEYLRFLSQQGGSSIDESATTSSPSLESLSSSSVTTAVNKKQHPRDKIYETFFANTPLAFVKSSPTPPQPSLPMSANGASTTASSTLSTSSLAAATAQVPPPLPTHHVDKENYYNSSRRENLAPLNSYEYRNSYKDVYDNQGVRVNPAIIKSLQAAAAAATTSSASTVATTAQSTSSTSASGPKSSITITKKDCEAVSVTDNATTAAVATNILNDHTYKTSITATVGSACNMQSPTKKTQSDDIIDTSTNGTDCCQVTFSPGEFLIHKATFSGDASNYDIWCVLDTAYLQKYEPVMLLTGERCHQSADVLAQYTQNKDDFVVVRVQEKGKTESDNIVVAVLNEYEPKNNAKIAAQLNLKL